MPQQRISEIQELLFQLERRIKPLEWDLSRNQINEFKKLELERLREQHTTLSQELEQSEQRLAQEKVAEPKE